MQTEFHIFPFHIFPYSALYIAKRNFHFIPYLKRNWQILETEKHLFETENQCLYTCHIYWTIKFSAIPEE